MTQIQAASKSGARPATARAPPPKEYAAPNSPRDSATASTSASANMLRRRRRALKPSNIFGVSLNKRTRSSIREYISLRTAGSLPAPKIRPVRPDTAALAPQQTIGVCGEPHLGPVHDLVRPQVVGPRTRIAGVPP